MSRHSKKRQDERLVLSVLEGDSQRVEALLREGGNVDARDKEHGEPVLALALRFGHHQIAHILLEHSADVNAKDNRGRSILSLASCVDKKTGEISEGYKAVLWRGVDINSVDLEGRSVLSWQLAAGLPLKAIEFLLSVGADPTLQDDTGESALSIAQSYGFIGAIEMMKSALKDKSA